MSSTDTRRPARPWGVLIGTLFLIALIAVWAAQGTLSETGLPVGRAATIAVGMTLQAIPFLLLGVFVAELIGLSSPPLSSLASFRRTRSLPSRQHSSSLSCFRCAIARRCRSSAPCCARVFHSAATTLMLASPAINPLVIASTYYAFGSWSLVATRIGLSVIVALSVGLSMLVASPRALRADGVFHDGDACGCAGGCAVPDRSFSGVLGATGQSFGRILPYLLGGVAASTLAQVLWPVSALLAGLPAPAALALMMGAGFALSLCSSSDAVIARSLASLAPTGALMGFMVYGPMMDVKNVALLASQFRGTFVIRLFMSVSVAAATVIGCAWWAGVLS